MDVLPVYFLIGISFGFILFLLATGLTLTMGLMRIVKLAHGALYMVGGYVGLSVARLAEDSVGRDLAFLLGILAGGLCAGLLGLIMETGFLRRLYKRELDQVLLTIGFIYILINVTQWIWGPVPEYGYVPSILSGSVPVGGITLPVSRLAIIGFGLFAAAGLWLFQEKTRVGAIIRAGMDNKEMTTGLGINLKLVFTGVFALGAFVAGFCGLIGSPLLGVNLGVGWDALLLAMIVVIVGGTGSVQGALVGGIVIGLVDSFGSAYFPQLASFTMYLVLIIILLFRPSGLMGRAMQPGGGERQPGPLLVHYFAPIVGISLVLLILPPFLSTYFLSMVTKVLIFDCDGVLFDSKDANIAFYNHILSHLHLPPMTQEEVEYVHASTAEGALRHLFTNRDPHLLDKGNDYRRGIDYTPFIHLMRMEPYLKELLKALPPPIKKAVSTNRTYTIGDVLRLHGLEGEFDLVVSALDVKNPKPHPDSIMTILQHFSITPSQALFVGDSEVDQDAAQAALVPFVAYKNRSLRADYHIDDLLQIKEIIDWREGR